MIRYIKIEDSKKRDAEITFKSINSGSSISLALETGEKPITKKVLKSSKDHNLESLIGKESPSQEEYNKFSERLLEKDTEIDFELFGMFINKTDRIYTNKNNEPVFNIKVVQKINDPNGNLIKEQKPIYLQSNINEENIVKWTGKFIPKVKLYNKVILSSKYQIKHVNGLTFDFLFNIAKLLHEKGYEVYGIIRGQHNPRREAVEAEFPYVKLIEADLGDQSSLIRAMQIAKPDEVYNLGAISHVGYSFKDPMLTNDITAKGVLNMLEAIRLTDTENKVRFYQASTSELYGEVQEVPQTEKTPFYPRSPYGVANTEARVPLFVDETYQNDPVQHCDAEDGDKADRRRHRQILPGDEESEEPAARRERYVGDNQRSVFH